jgi:hypothetical protein
MFNRMNERKLKPVTADEITECSTPEGRRKRIFSMTRNDAFIRAVIRSHEYVAHKKGLPFPSELDILTDLAYEALIYRESDMQRRFDEAMLDVSPRFVVDESGIKSPS